MTIIWFNVNEAYSFLMKNGEVYTLRDHPKVEGKANLMSSIEGRPFYKGKVEIKLIDVFPRENVQLESLVEKYLSKSGFSTSKEWLSRVKKSDSKFLYVYLVKIEDLKVKK